MEGQDGCRTGRSAEDTNGSGFWLFSRQPVDPESTAIMRRKAEEMGLDLSVLVPVKQEGCEYEGAE